MGYLADSCNKLGMLMFITSNIAGSTIQITTLPLPVLSTLQAVRSGNFSSLRVATYDSTVWPGIQLYLCYPDPWRAFHAMVFRRNSLSLRWSCTNCNFWSYRRTSAQSRPIARTSGKAAIYSLDDWPSDPGGSYNCGGKSSQIYEPLDEQQPTDASL